MDSQGAKKRSLQTASEPAALARTGADLLYATEAKEADSMESGKHGAAVQLLRLALFAAWFTVSVVCIHVTQYIGLPLYILNRDYYYAYMALTKQSFGLVIVTVTQWFSQILIRISGDASMRGQLRQTDDGRLETMFPERLILIANHQLYTDWLYLWWIAYTSRMHGHLYIILKDTLKYIPILGQGMMFYSFVFLKRKWQRDMPRLRHRLEKLKSRHAGPMSGSQTLDPMWLLIFPEGTNLSEKTRTASKAWAEKQHMPDMDHQLLPRSTGLYYCLRQLNGTVDWVYDCTVAYEGTSQGGYPQDYFTLKSIYFEGRRPKSVNMYWRRFPISQIPLDDIDHFNVWLRRVWREKDQVLEYYKQTGRFPADEEALGTEKQRHYIETEVKMSKWYEVGQIFVVLATVGLIVNCMVQLYRVATGFSPR